MEENSTFELPAITEQAILHCQFNFWFPLFKHVSLKSKVIPLSEKFIEYLHSDGVVVNESRIHEIHPDFEGNDDESEAEIPTFPELEAQIQEAIEEYDAVFPKLNWSSPKDAVWITTTGSLKCDTFSEVFLLLKSSDFISHDLSHAFDQCVDTQRKHPDQFFLVLRKWFNLHTSLEFRCFVSKKYLVGICQRDPTNFYPFLAESKDKIKELIVQFYYNTISHIYPEDDFIFDVYISKNHDKVWILDFNPFGTITEPLMFTWEEICLKKIPSTTFNPDPNYRESHSELLERADFRIVESQQGIFPLSSQLNRYPKDIIDMSAEGISKFVEQFRNGTFSQDSSDSESENDE